MLQGYRAYSIRRSHTVNFDVDLNYLRSHTAPQNADLNHLRSHGAPQNADLNTAKKNWSLQCLPPRRMELANFRIEKPVNISPEKLSSRVVKLQKFHVHSVHVHVQPPIKIQNHRKSPYKLCLKKACLLCSPPSSALVMGLFFLDPPIVNIHMVRTRLGTGVPRCPESNVPINSLCPPSFPSQPTCSGYLQLTVLPLSLFLLPPPVAPPPPPWAS